MRRIATVCVGLLGCTLLQACGATLPVGSAEQRERLAALRYPADARQGEPLQLEAIRDGKHLRFINREPREFRRVTLWLNQQYAGVAERIAPGSYENVGSNSVPLGAFINRYGEPFPTGNFLAPDDTQALVSVEMVFDDDDGSTRRPLTVWPDRRWFEE
ncbi:MAG: hypothetical protein AAGE65_04745 [Planctomycetota bacterium]